MTQVFFALALVLTIAVTDARPQPCDLHKFTSGPGITTFTFNVSLVRVRGVSQQRVGALGLAHLMARGRLSPQKHIKRQGHCQSPRLKTGRAHLGPALPQPYNQQA